MMHPDTCLTLINPTVGLGVVATRRIPRGTVIWAPDALDLKLPDRHARELPSLVLEQLRRHAYLTDDGEWVWCWDHARFVNHSCAANTLPTADGLEICVRDILEGEEVTNDYAFFNLAPDEEFPCACGSSACRGLVSSIEADSLRASSQSAANAAQQLSSHVPQALQPILRAQG